jgi:cell division protein FtsL
MITRINLILLILLVACALSVVTSQHRARKTFMELIRQQDIAAAHDVEFDRLRLEQRTWAMHSRIEKVARLNLKMQAPDPKRIRVLNFPARP